MGESLAELPFGIVDITALGERTPPGQAARLDLFLSAKLGLGRGSFSRKVPLFMAMLPRTHSYELVPMAPSEYCLVELPSDMEADPFPGRARSGRQTGDLGSPANSLLQVLPLRPFVLYC